VNTDLDIYVFYKNVSQGLVKNRTLVLINYIKLGTLNWSNPHRCPLPSVGSFGQVVSEEKIFRNLSTCHVVFDVVFI
jgi:hypothetical protein